ncbi:hypothetical protein BN938_0732 [Mucinivorans hirudinis]|uniref:Endonuclease GajA/Old nuclease/RecF-like AAA domain-containing protein n=1 Tax=Mucinivorans hirudinis TaxID=1433126 RepID=A0A060R6Z7_9BACT|nr:hypothetical protein BN938_0732 [Mucinivorans hirudinis]
MKLIKIRNFGAISSGFVDNDGFMNIDKVTMIIGDQGSGKSTVAKLISTFCWLEKALMQDALTTKYVEQRKRFQNNYCAFNNLTDYFKEDTFIEFHGDSYIFKFEGGRLNISKRADQESYNTPQIMYVPSERNFLSVIEKVEGVKQLPLSLKTFFIEYDKARKEDYSIDLPIGGVKFNYDRQNKITSIILGGGKKLKLSFAASGFQSYIPLYLVTRYLYNSNKYVDLSEKKFSDLVEMLDNLDIESRMKVIQAFNKKITPNSKSREDERVNVLAEAIQPFINTCFINIVEEPEQNLFPESQKVILYELMRCANSPNNQLIITTHSPYLINALSIAAKAYQVHRSESGRRHENEIEKIVPIETLVDNDKINIYQIDNDGSIQLLQKYDGVPTDSNYLNEILGDSNNIFARLLEIEDGIE